MTTEAICCSKCSRPLGADDVNLSTGLARCRSCNLAFRVGGGAGTIQKEPVTLPRGMRFFRDGLDLVIERRWFGAHAVLLLLFCLFWDGFMVLWLLTTAKHPSVGGIAAFLLMPHLWVGLILTYFTACLWVNRTTFRINEGNIDVRVGPLPAFGNKRIAATEVEQLYCRRLVGSKGSVNWSLMLLTKDQKRVQLAGSLAGREEALYLEQQIEAALGIQDRHVEGEFIQDSATPTSLREMFQELFRKSR